MGLRISTGSSNVWILSSYAPIGTEGEARAVFWAECTELMNKLRGERIIFGGDWNSLVFRNKSEGGFGNAGEASSHSYEMVTWLACNSDLYHVGSFLNCVYRGNWQHKISHTWHELHFYAAARNLRGAPQTIKAVAMSFSDHRAKLAIWHLPKMKQRKRRWARWNVHTCRC